MKFEVPKYSLIVHVRLFLYKPNTDILETVSNQNITCFFFKFFSDYAEKN